MSSSVERRSNPAAWAAFWFALAGLVLGPERTARHVFVEGDYVVRDGALVGADIVTLRAELTRRARRLWPERARA